MLIAVPGYPPATGGSSFDESPPMNSWRARTILAKVFFRLGEQPGALTVSLLVVPTVWNLVADMAYRQVVPEVARGSGEVSPWIDAAMLGATTVWALVVYGGQLLIAIDAARGLPVNWRRFREGASHTWRLTFGVLPAVPLLAVSCLPDGALLEVIAIPLLLAAIAATVVAVLRTVVWGPLIVDSNAPVIGAFVTSWRATRGSLWKLMRLGLLLCVAVLPVAACEVLFGGSFHITFGLFGALCAMTMAELYVRIPGRHAARREEPAQLRSSSGAEIPTKGSGWSHPYD